MYISYDYYRVFYYVAKYKGVTRAANVLINDQPNVTRTIKNLENQLGCTLFIRSNRGVRLTPEGERLYSHVSAAVEQIQSGEEELSRANSLKSGTVSISSSEIALFCLLPTLGSYREKYPDVKLRVSNQSTPQAIAALRDGESDIALVTTPTGSADSLDVTDIREIHETAICGQAFADIAERRLSFEELLRLPIISLGRHTKTYELYSGFFIGKGLEFSPSVEVATADQVLPMAENNLGIGFLPKEFIIGRTSGITELTLKEPLPTRRICLIKRPGNNLNTAAKELERMIRENNDFSQMR